MRIIGVALLVAGCALAQVPADLQRFCSAYDSNYREVESLKQESDRIAKTVPPGENRFEAQDRRAKYMALDQEAKAKQAAFRDSSPTFFAAGGTISNWVGTLRTFGHFMDSSLWGNTGMTVQIETTCAGGAQGKLVVILKPVDPGKIYASNHVGMGGLPLDNPILNSMRSYHVGDTVRVSGRLVRTGTDGQRFTVLGGLYESGDRHTELAGHIVLTSIEKISAPNAAAQKPPAAICTIARATGSCPADRTSSGYAQGSGFSSSKLRCYLACASD